MNWTDPDFLPWHRHKDLALFVVQTSLKFAPDSIAGNFIHDSVRQIGHLAGKLRRTPEQAFTSWAWEMCSRLRLHRLDGNWQQRPAERFVDLDLDDVCLGEAVAVKNPLACFVALQASQTGHLIEDILERGLKQLSILASSGHFDHVLECVVNITPVFLEQPDMLWTAEDFIKLVQSITSVDQTYIKMAKDLVVTDFPGPVLKEFSNLLAWQIECYPRYNLRSPNTLITLWLRVLTQVPGWMTNKSVLYAIDNLCKASMAPVGGSADVKSVFKQLDTQLLSSTGNGFMSWLSSSKSPSSMLTPVMSDCAWCAFFVLEVCPI